MFQSHTISVFRNLFDLLIAGLQRLCPFICTLDLLGGWLEMRQLGHAASTLHVCMCPIRLAADVRGCWAVSDRGPVAVKHGMLLQKLHCTLHGVCVFTSGLLRPGSRLPECPFLPCCRGVIDCRRESHQYTYSPSINQSHTYPLAWCE
jgi:hypothetical protein